jgi:hypothetical protein
MKDRFGKTMSRVDEAAGWLGCGIGSCSLIITLIILGVIVWAVIKLVLKFT